MLRYQRFKSSLDLHEIWYRRSLQEVIFVNICLKMCHNLIFKSKCTHTFHTYLMIFVEFDMRELHAMTSNNRVLPKVVHSDDHVMLSDAD